MALREHEFIKLISKEMSADDIDVLCQIIECAGLSPELYSIRSIIIKLSKIHDAALPYNWPPILAQTLSVRSQVLHKCLTTKVYQSRFYQDSKNPIYGRIGDYPLAALYCESLGQNIEASIEHLLLLLMFILFTMNEHENKNNAKKAMIKEVADTLRLLWKGKEKLNTTINSKDAHALDFTSLLSRLTSANIIIFQKQYIRRWKELYIKLHEQQPANVLKNVIAQRINKGVYRSKNQKIFTSNNGLIVQSELNVDTSSLFKDTPEDCVNELIRLSVPPEKTFDYRTKKAALLYGNRLSLIELKQLPWRTNSLEKHEIECVVSSLNTSMETDCESTISAVIIFMVLLTSKQLSDVIDITMGYGNSQHDGDHIDLSEGVWVRQSIVMPSAFEPNELQKQLLHPYTNTLRLPLPKNLLERLRSNYDVQQSKQTLNDLYVAKTPTIELSVSITSYLNNIAKDKVFRTITLAAIRATLFQTLSHHYDSSTASLVLANTEYDNPTSLYYLSESCVALIDKYQYCVQTLGVKLSECVTRNTLLEYTGSQIAFNSEKIKSIIESRIRTIRESSLSKNMSFNELITAYNQFSAYCVLMFIASTSHRPKTEFGCVPYVINEVDDVLLVCDKVNHVDSAVRLLPLTNMLKSQLRSYRHFCLNLSRFVAKFDSTLSTQLFLIGQNEIVDTPFFATIVNDEMKPVSKVDVENLLQPEFSLPLNAFRHFFSSYVRRPKTFSLAKSLVGHVSHGEHVLANTSCFTINDLMNAKVNIDGLLEQLGFDVIVFTPLSRANKEVSRLILKKPYIPDFLKIGEKLQRSTEIRSVRKLIEPFLKQLKDEQTKEQTKTLLVNQILNTQSKSISKSRKIFLLNRFLDKIDVKNQWLSLKNNSNEIHIDTDVIDKLKNKRQLILGINHWLINQSNIGTGDDIKLISIWFSLIVNSGLTVSFNTENLNVIVNLPYKEHGITWFEFKKGTKTQRVIVDPLTQLLLIKYQSIKSINFNLYELNKIVKATVLKAININSSINVSKLTSADQVSCYLSSCRSIHQSGVVYGYQNELFETTILSSFDFTRWLSPHIIKKSSIELDKQEINTFSQYIYQGGSQPNFEQSLKVIKQLHKALTPHLKKVLNQSKNQIKNIIINSWASSIGLIREGESFTGSLIELENASSTINDVIVVMFLWLIDVAKRPGRSGRKHAAASTVKTYLSDISKPLLESVSNYPFRLLEQDELYDLYRQTLDIRDIQNRAQRASRLKDFHLYAQRHFNLPVLDWYAIEPSLSSRTSDVNANIISMHEYQNAVELLKTDEYFDNYERSVNQIILILCYRAGLRVSEATHLKIDDIDTKHWTLHVRTNYLRRLKTSHSNRRIPIGLFLSLSEKELILQHINAVKSYHRSVSNLWLFSDKTNVNCFVNISRHVSRLRESLQIACGGNDIRLHNARHSFANYLLLIMKEGMFAGTVQHELLAWARADDLRQFSQSLKQVFIGEKQQSEHILHAISLAMGHVDVSTTFRNYIHVMDIIKASENQRSLLDNIDKSKLISLTGVERTYGYKILQRGNYSQYGYQPLADYCMKQWDEYQRITTSESIQSVQLHPLKSNTHHNMLVSLHDIERVLRATELRMDYEEIATKFELDYNFVTQVINAAEQITIKTAYTGFSLPSRFNDFVFKKNIKKQLSSSKYIYNANFKSLLSNISLVLDLKTQSIKLANYWVEYFDKSHGLVIPVNQKMSIENEINAIGYKARMGDQDYKIHRKSGYRIGHAVELIPRHEHTRQYQDNKIHHALFLLATYCEITSG